MRDAADDVHAEVERALEIARCVRGTEIAVLRKGDELQIEIGLHLLFHLDERLDGDQAVVADVDMAANGEQALRDGEIAVAQRTLRHRFVSEVRLEFAPEGDSLEQRAGDVEAGKAERQRRVQVKVAIDEGRREKVSAPVDRLPRLGHDRRLDRGDAAGGDRDVLPFAPVRQRGVADDQIEGHAASPRLLRQSSRMPERPPSPKVGLGKRLDVKRMTRTANAKTRIAPARMSTPRSGVSWCWTKPIRCRVSAVMPT